MITVIIGTIVTVFVVSYFVNKYLDSRHEKEKPTILLSKEQQDKLVSVNKTIDTMFESIKHGVINGGQEILDLPDDELIGATITLMIEERMRLEGTLPQELLAQPARLSSEDEFEKPEFLQNKKITYH